MGVIFKNIYWVIDCEYKKLENIMLLLVLLMMYNGGKIYFVENR